MHSVAILLVLGLVLAINGLPGPFVTRDSCEVPMTQINGLNDLLENFLKSDKSDRNAEDTIQKIESEQYNTKPDQCFTTLQNTRAAIKNLIQLTVKLNHSSNHEEQEKLKQEILDKADKLSKRIKDLQKEVEELANQLILMEKESTRNDFILAVYNTILGKVDEAYKIFQQIDLPDKVTLFTYNAYRVSSIKYLMQFVEKMPAEQTKMCQIVYDQIFLNDDAVNPRVYQFDYYVRKFVKAGTASLDVNKYRQGLRDGIVAKMKEIGLILADKHHFRNVYEYEGKYPGFFDLYLEMFISASMEQDRRSGHNLLDMINKFPTEQKARIFIQMYQETLIGNQDYSNMLSLPPRIAYMLKNFVKDQEYQTLKDDKLKQKLEAVRKELNENRFMSVVGETVRFTWPMSGDRKAYLAVTTKKLPNNQPWIYLDNPDVPNDWQPVIDWNVKTMDNGRTFLLEPKGFTGRYLHVDRDKNLSLTDEITDENRWWLLDYPHNGRLNPAKDEYSGKQFICTLYNSGFLQRLMVAGDEWPRPPKDVLRMLPADDGNTWNYPFTMATTWIQNYWEVILTSNSV